MATESSQGLGGEDVVSVVGMGDISGDILVDIGEGIAVWEGLAGEDGYSKVGENSG